MLVMFLFTKVVITSFLSCKAAWINWWMWCDSGVAAGVALCIVRTGFYSKNYVVWMTAAIRLTAPPSASAEVGGG